MHGSGPIPSNLPVPLEILKQHVNEGKVKITVVLELPDTPETLQLPSEINLSPLQTAAFLAATGATTDGLPPVIPENHLPTPTHPEST